MTKVAGEFDLIARHFAHPAPESFLGVGDDCALMPVQAGMQVATSTDLLLEGRHFLPGTDPYALGHKALAVNLSDLAAMGARPLGCLLGLGLPSLDDAWLSEFAKGFRELAQSANCPLLGGDTTRSLNGITLSVTVFGQVAPVHALRRNAARPDDDIWLTGTLGAPDIALRLLTGALPMQADLLNATRAALERPDPPVAFAPLLAGIAHAALDISDGLLQDLGHILSASRCGAQLWYDALPVHPALSDLPENLLQEAVLGGGDVYQLCFTAAPESREAIANLAEGAGVQLSRIGRITPREALTVLDHQGRPLSPTVSGFDHFRTV